MLKKVSLYSSSFMEPAVMLRNNGLPFIEYIQVEAIEPFVLPVILTVILELPVMQDLMYKEQRSRSLESILRN